MTVSELIAILKGYDPSDLVCVFDTYHRGVFPVEDTIETHVEQCSDADTHCVVFHPTSWP